MKPVADPSDDAAFVAWSDRVILDAQLDVATKPDATTPEPPFETFPAAYIRRVVIRHLKGRRTIRSGLESKRMRFTGTVNLENLEIGFPLRFLDCEFDGPIRGTGAKTKTLSFTNSVLHQGADLRSAHVDGGLFLRGAFRSHGPLILRDMKIEGTLDLRGGRFLYEQDVGPDPFAATLGDCLGLSRTEATGLFWAKDSLMGKPHPADFANQPPKGLVTWRDLKVRAFRHDLQEQDSLRAWPACGELVLDGFTYDRIDDASRDTLLAWLDLQHEGATAGTAPDACWLSQRATGLRKWWQGRPAPTPTPYFQLASVLEKQGRKDDAGRIRAQVRRHEVEAMAQPKRVLAQLFFLPVAYGASAWRAFGLALALFGFFFALVASLNASGGLAPASDSLLRDPCFYGSKTCAAGVEWRSVFRADSPPTGRFVPQDYPQFHAFEYSLESFLPVLDFGQRQNWEPASRGARFILAIIAFLGLFLGSLSAAAVSGLLMPRSG